MRRCFVVWEGRPRKCNVRSNICRNFSFEYAGHAIHKLCGQICLGHTKGKGDRELRGTRAQRPFCVSENIKIQNVRTLNDFHLTENVH